MPGSSPSTPITMPGLGIYHRFRAGFVRAEERNQPVSLSGPWRSVLRHYWCHMPPGPPATSPGQIPIFTITGVGASEESPSTRTRAPTPSTTKTVLKLEQIDKTDLVLYQRMEGNCTKGIIIQQPDIANLVLDDFVASLLLDHITLFTSPLRKWKTELASVTNAIVTLFDDQLRYNTAPCDKWDIDSRTYFTKCVHNFVERGSKVEFCLPAFPCKSPNLEKVAGEMPDMGEQLALEHLHSFVEAIERIYEPGAKVWILTNGHVFSDCVGVSDETVDRYNAELKAMSDLIGEKHDRSAKSGSKPDRIGFKSPIDLFDLHDASSFPTLDLAGVTNPNTQANCPTTLSASLSRQMLLSTCQTLPSIIRYRIKSESELDDASNANSRSTLKLYRFFTRSMKEDLAHLISQITADTTATDNTLITRSQLKKLAHKIAFEMMIRNEAYSNLIELLFPFYIRLSIHAQDNGGPRFKFGINLFARGGQQGDDRLGHTEEGRHIQVWASPALLYEGATSAAENPKQKENDNEEKGNTKEEDSNTAFHIPTPWDNCVVKLTDRMQTGQSAEKEEEYTRWVVAQAKVIKAALAMGSYSGGWVERGQADQDGESLGGGYFCLKYRTKLSGDLEC